MSFFILKVFRKLQRNLAIYTVLALELAIGVAFIVYAVSAKISVDEPLKFYKENYPETLVELTSSTGSDALNQIAADDIAVLQEKLQGFALKTLVPASFFTRADGILETNFVVYQALPDLPQNQCYYGATLADELRVNGTIKDAFGRYELTSTELIDKMQNLRFSITALPAKYANTIDTLNLGGRTNNSDDAIHTFAYADSIFLPQAYAEKARNGALLTHYLWDTNVATNAEDLMAQALAYLAPRYPQIDLIFRYPGKELVRTTQDMLGTSKMFGAIGWLVIAEMTIGFTGVILLFMQRRRQELAICMAIGARRSILSAELLAEIGTFCAIGCGVGAWCGYLLTSIEGARYVGGIVDFHPRSAAILIGLAVGIVCTLFASLPLLYKIGTEQTDVLLRGE
ncbi:MAG: ABC transporter permease [Oscillospiraceae bacterium]